MSDHSAQASGGQSSDTVVGVIAWLWVLIPFLWGVWQLLIKVVPLFSH